MMSALSTVAAEPLTGAEFAPLMAPFLARHFAEVTVLERVYWPLAFDGAMTAALRADVTLLETVERALPDLAAAPRNRQLRSAARRWAADRQRTPQIPAKCDRSLGINWACIIKSLPSPDSLLRTPSRLR